MRKTKKTQSLALQPATFGATDKPITPLLLIFLQPGHKWYSASFCMSLSACPWRWAA